ncbi:MAG TPA: FAD-dependent oxidoreductase [Thermoanaerobaculia bacterium]|nr:FAD-dependent oxidoreductase [Thermoanaerobaculia bacterium]
MHIQSDIVIAGAGVIGASVAFHLAQRGCKDIVVIDRGEDFGAGSTLKATGGFRAQFDNETEVRLSLLSREKLRAFEEEVGVDSGYRPYGYLFLACNEQELDDLRRAQSVQHACGLHEAQMLSADEVRKINPKIGDDSVIGGAYCATDGFIRAKNILRGYADAAQRLGVRFQFNTELRDWSDVAARVKIEARGAWSGAPVFPLRRNVAATVVTDVLAENMPMTIWSGDWYHVRVRDGRVLILWPDDPPDDTKWLRELNRRTEERMPCLIGVPLEEFWWGFYEMTPDERALLGEWNGIYYATGASGHGVMHSPALGHLLAELIVDGRTSIDISGLRPDRFS